MKSLQIKSQIQKWRAEEIPKDLEDCICIQYRILQ